jgi:hypothetical protein
MHVGSRFGFLFENGDGLGEWKGADVRDAAVKWV